MNKKALRLKISICMMMLSMLISCQSIKQKPDLSYQVDSFMEADNLQENNNLAESKYLEQDNPFLEKDVGNTRVDYGYKMLYGKWLVENKVGESYRLDIQDISDVIGKMFKFSREKVNLYYNGQEIEIEFPEYDIVIIPLDEQTTYFPYMPTMNKLGINGNYVTIFSIKGYDTYFILKDDESLIMFYKDAYLELKRIEHEDGYNSFYHAL
jgi:hypothetical protein